MTFDQKIYADFNNADREGRIRLNSEGSIHDIKSCGITLENGIKLLLDDDDEIKTIGTAMFSISENIWVAEIDWKLIM